jgi:hypothetical protein
MPESSSKKFRIAADQIRSIATGRGSCIATDMITVDGQKVAFMYRESPTSTTDSGWRFMAGFESQDYMDNPAHLAVYDVNTIVNYDSEIVPFLDAPIGSAFERPKGTGGFIEVRDFSRPD